MRFVVTGGLLLRGFSEVPSQQFLELWFQGRWRLVFDRDTLTHYCRVLRSFGFEESEVRAWAWNLRERRRSDFVEPSSGLSGSVIAYPVERIAAEQAVPVVFANETEKALGSNVDAWVSVEDALEMLQRCDL